MVGSGKSGKGRAGHQYLIIQHAKALGPNRTSMSTRAGLQFPVHHFRRRIKNSNPRSRVGPYTGVYVTAVIEYMMAEVLELAGKAAGDHKKKRITPRHLQLAVRNDDELDRVFHKVIIYQGGVVPHIHPQLLPTKVATRTKTRQA